MLQHSSEHREERQFPQQRAAPELHPELDCHLATSEASRSIRVLVVGSDLQHGTQLAQQPGDMRVSCLAPGSEALAAAAEQSFDCVVVQQSSTDGEALWFIRQLRQHNGQSLLPVVLVIAEYSEELASTLQDGFADYLGPSAPSPGALSGWIKKLVERRRSFDALQAQLLGLQRHNNVLRRRCESLAEDRQKVAASLLTPLTAVQEFISLVLDGAGGAISDRQGKLLALARGSCMQLGNAVQAYLEPSGSRGLDTAVFGPLALEQWLDDMLEIFALQAAHRGVHFACTVAPEFEQVCVDEYRLREVLLALIPEVLDVCAPNQTLWLSAESDSVDARGISFVLRSRLAVVVPGEVCEAGAATGMPSHESRCEVLTFGDPGPAQVVVEKLLDENVNFQFTIVQLGTGRP